MNNFSANYGKILEILKQVEEKSKSFFIKTNNVS